MENYPKIHGQTGGGVATSLPPEYSIASLCVAVSWLLRIGFHVMSAVLS